MRFCTFAAGAESLTTVLAENDQLINETTLFHPPDDLLTLLQQVLDISGWTFADLDFIGVVHNPPGEQNPTQIEPGLKVAQKLQLPVVSVLAVDTWAWLAQEYDRELIVINPAGEQYWLTASYIWNKTSNCPLCLKPPHLTEPETLLKQLANRKEPFLLAGGALKIFKECVKTILGTHAVLLSSGNLQLNPRYIAQATWHQWLKLGPEKTPFSLYSTQLDTKGCQTISKIYPKPNSSRKPFMAQSMVRPMHEEDLKQIMKIELRSFAFPWSPLAFVSELRYNQDAYYYSLINQDQVIGYIGLWLISDKGYIIKIAISPEHRRQGWGKYLIQHIFREPSLANITEISLELRRSNQAAYRFYQKLGFKRSGVLPGYYDNPVEDAIIMSYQRHKNK